MVVVVVVVVVVAVAGGGGGGGGAGVAAGARGAVVADRGDSDLLNCTDGLYGISTVKSLLYLMFYSVRLCSTYHCKKQSELAAKRKQHHMSSSVTLTA